MRTASGLNVIAGTWLFISAWVLGYGDDDAAVATAVVTGAIVTLLALIRVSVVFTQAWPSMVNVAAGSWTFFSPWILGFSDIDRAFWNNLFVGLAILVLAAASASATARYEEDVR